MHRLVIGGMDAVEAHPGALLCLPFELVGFANHRRSRYVETGFALGPGQAGASRKRGVGAGIPVGCADAHNGAEGLSRVDGQLAAAPGASKPGEQGAGKRSGVKATGLRIAERVLGQGARGDSAGQRVRMGESCIEAEQGGEGLPSIPGSRDGPAGQGRLLDRGGVGHDLRVPHPGLPLGAKPGRVEPIEELAEKVGVVLAHT